MDTARVLDVLALARALVEAGWGKGYSLREGQVCAEAALLQAERERGVGDLKAFYVLYDTCRRRYGKPIFLFNDDSATTKRQVLALFDHAAARVGKG